MIINEYCNELLKEILKKNKKKNTKLIIDFINNIDKDHLQAIQYSKYCGIKYIIELIEISKLIKPKILKKNVFIIDGMNIIHNKEILYLCSLINKFDLTTIDYKQLINILKNIFPLLLIKFGLINTTIFIIYQSNEFTFEEKYNCYFIGISCIIKYNESIISCNKININNESDDIAVLFLYYYIKNIILNNNVNIWTYDSYKWFNKNEIKLINKYYIEIINKNNYKLIPTNKKIAPKNIIINN